jgi:putative CocE/NonD family hydrolase
MLAHAFASAHAYQPQSGPTRPPKVDVPFDWGTEDGYQYFLEAGTLRNLTARLGGNPTWQELVDHPTYDVFWQSRSIWRHLQNIHCPVLVVGGWFDAEDLSGPLRTYHAIKDGNPGTSTTLVMGPWTHGGWSAEDGRRLGAVDFASATAAFYRERVVVPFFEHHLKDAADPDLPGALVFETGTNVWRRYVEWPAPGAEARTLHFREHGGLSFEAPADEDADDAYRSDPARPVPWVGYTTLSMPTEYMVSDQRFAATRPDVLVYATEPLDEDLTIVGPVSPRLFVSTSGTDSDWVVKLIDVYPPDRSSPEAKADGGDAWSPPVPLAGYQQLVRGWPLRGKFRHGFEKPEPFEPGKVEELAFDMPDVNHVFRRGHRVMVQVQSTWFPLIDRNPQSFVDIPNAEPSDFQAATQRVVRSRTEPSGVIVNVLSQP